MLKHARPRLALLLIAAMPFAIAKPIALAQTIAAPASTTRAGKPILFEVVSIRPIKSNVVYGKGYTADGYSMRGISVWSLVTYYTEHPSDRMDAVPDWAMHQQYDIEAKVADADVAAWGKLESRQKVLAVYAMLEDRFKLKVHREMREFPGYALVVAKNGSKLKEATPGEIYPKKLRSFDGGAFHGITLSGPGEATAQGASMEELANMLQAFAASPVADRTGLKGTYDFVLRCPPPAGPPTLSGAGDSAASEPSGPSIFTVLQEELGLKLEKAKVPIDYVVVDHLERPSEN